ncbi:MAG: hypothetical protein IT247_00665 [Bacteroidia bacterium]|nr:hypothetical protein [Bacteroidia bacterium]
MKKILLFILLFPNTQTFSQAIQSFFEVDTTLKIEVNNSSISIWNTTQNDFYYLKNYDDEGGHINLVNYNVLSGKVDEIIYGINSSLMKEMYSERIRSIAKTGDSLFFLTNKHLFGFHTLIPSKCELKYRIALFNKRARLYLPIYINNNRLLISRYSEPIKGKIPFLEIFEVDFKTQSLISRVHSYNSLGQLYLNSKQSNQVFIGFDKIVVSSPIDYEISVFDISNKESIKVDTIRDASEGWISINPATLSFLDMSYERNPSIKVLDSLALLEEKYISRINHICLLNHTNLLVQYSINDTSSLTLSLPKNRFTRKCYVDIWESQPTGWKKKISRIEDNRITESDSLVSKEYFELLLSFSEVLSLNNKLLVFKQLPEIIYGEKWGAFNKRRFSQLKSGEMHPTLVIFSLKGIYQ